MSIALDAMGGDHAPREVVLGAVEACKELHSQLLLVGDPSEIERFLPSPSPRNLHIHPASQVIGMDEKPTEALRKKKDSSIMVGADLVKTGKAKAFVSAGNTGACTAACLLSWRQIPGIHRPAIASLMPNKHGQFLLLDAGASPDVDPEHLVEFALMGRAYMERVVNRAHPKVHLLNIGEEEGKGNAFSKQAYLLLSKYPWFAGNIEGKDMYAQPCDVVLCDAFVGNVVLKTSEGVAELIMSVIKENVPQGPFRALYWPVKKVLQPLRKQMDYAEVGGSPLLGLNGLCIICHGRSNARAIRNALLLAERAVEGNVVEAIGESVERDLMISHG
ncbi:MAG TPA: phosphate acyltransferase PlsX [Fimbriimonadaceae bacterium]|nr:phosphate acyltransferase PlsX [Fimbriimonadaceae bacterium]